MNIKVQCYGIVLIPPLGNPIEALQSGEEKYVIYSIP